MKILFLSILIVFAASAARAQIKTKVQKTRLQAPSKIIDPVPAEPKTPPSPPPTNKSSNTSSQDIPVYTLTSARVNIRTGNDNKEFPSQHGGVWSDNSTGKDGGFGPGPKLDGPYPSNVYLRDPGIPSGSTCRGACGPNCDTCEETPEYIYFDPVSGETWRYTNFHVLRLRFSSNSFVNSS